MDSIGMSCIKYLMFLFNLLFAVCGIAILSIGLMIQNIYSKYSLFTGDKLFSLPYIFMVVGIFIFVVSFFGCCGAIKEGHLMLMAFALLLGLIFVMEIVAGVAAYVWKDDLNVMLETRMSNSLREYEINQYYKNTWNALQSDLTCCGVRDQDDWAHVYMPNLTLPHSCCSDAPVEENCLREDRRSKVNPDGCLPAIEKSLEKNIFLIIGFGAGVCFVQFMGVIFACCMCRSIRKYETV